MSEDGKNNTGFVALLHGGASSLSGAVARDLARKGVKILLSAQQECAQVREIRDFVEPFGNGFTFLPSQSEASEVSLIQQAFGVYQRLDILVNLHVPTETTSTAELVQYPERLLERGLEAGKVMAGSPRAAIVNQCFLPSLFAGTSLESHMPMLKGAITGVTRLLCRNLGKAGIRVNTIQTGLLDLPETRAFANEQVLKLKPPVGRWGLPEDVAKFISFLALRNGYMTGQAIILDGGMTAGNTGT